MNQDTIDGAQEIEKIARNVLIGSKAWGKFPTPVDQIVSYAELQVASGVDLSQVRTSFFTKKLHSLKRALSKVLAAVDLREKTIYLDLTQRPERQSFNKLHETGHKALIWQRDTYIHLDDEITLDPDTDELFERQASWFASDALFQLERFEDEAAKLPLTIKSPIAPTRGLLRSTGCPSPCSPSTTPVPLRKPRARHERQLQWPQAAAGFRLRLGGGRCAPATIR